METAVGIHSIELHGDGMAYDASAGSNLD